MFDYSVSYATHVPHRPLDNDWHNRCTRYEISYGVLNVYGSHNDEEYLKATYPAGQWTRISAFPNLDDENLGFAEIGLAPVVNQAQGQNAGVPNDFL